MRSSATIFSLHLVVARVSKEAGEEKKQKQKQKRRFKKNGPTKSQIDMAMLIRRFLIRCLVHAVERVRYQTKDTKERC